MSAAMAGGIFTILLSCKASITNNSFNVLCLLTYNFYENMKHLI